MTRPDSDWTSILTPTIPPCEPWDARLASATSQDLEAAWGVDSAPGPGGHVWARPDAMLGPEEHPGITEGGLLLRVEVEDLCLRCGTVRTVTINTTGVQVEYEVGAYTLTAADVLSERARHSKGGAA